MKKLIIVCSAVIFSAAAFAQNANSTGTNTSAVTVYKSPEILTDKAVAEAIKTSLAKPSALPNNVVTVTAPTQSTITAPPAEIKATPVKPVETAPTESIASKLGITVTPAGNLKPVENNAVSTPNTVPQAQISQDVKKTEAEIPASIAPAAVKKPAVLQ
jgi:hypothetical protein